MTKAEAHWRKYCPPGQEEAFKNTAERYQGSFGQRVAEATERSHDWELWVDKCCRSALRLRRARVARIIYAGLRKATAIQTAAAIPVAKMRGRQGGLGVSIKTVDQWLGNHPGK